MKDLLRSETVTFPAHNSSSVWEQSCRQAACLDPALLIHVAPVNINLL